MDDPNLTSSYEKILRLEKHTLESVQEDVKWLEQHIRYHAPFDMESLRLFKQIASLKKRASKRWLEVKAMRAFKKYGYPVEKYVQKYGEPCEACGFRPATVVDHCHQSGKARGLLCSQCNTAIGFAKDLPETLLNLAKYLIKFNA
jgi:recombination endonuclease VII